MGDRQYRTPSQYQTIGDRQNRTIQHHTEEARHTGTGNTVNAQTGTIHAGTIHAIATLLYPGVLG